MRAFSVPLSFCTVLCHFEASACVRFGFRFAQLQPVSVRVDRRCARPFARFRCVAHLRAVFECVFVCFTMCARACARVRLACGMSGRSRFVCVSVVWFVCVVCGVCAWFEVCVLCGLCTCVPWCGSCACACCVVFGCLCVVCVHVCRETLALVNVRSLFRRKIRFLPTGCQPVTRFVSGAGPGRVMRHESLLLVSP